MTKKQLPRLSNSQLVAARVEQLIVRQFARAGQNSKSHRDDYSPSQLVQDAQRHEIEVRPLDIRFSEWDNTLETVTGSDQPAIRLGMRLAKGLRKEGLADFFCARDTNPFTNIAELTTRGGLADSQLQCLIAAGALQGLSGHRHQAHWQALGIEEQAPLAFNNDDLDGGVELAAPTEFQSLAADYSHMGLTLERHPMILLREQNEIFRNCKTQSELQQMTHGRFVRVAGLVTGRQRPGTASGVLFLTLEDETGNTNVVVWKDLQERCRSALLKSTVMIVKGVVETDNNVVHVIGGHLSDCSHYLHDMALQSRDFH